MVKFINRHTGNVMWVSEDRAEEYKAAGHKLAASAFKPIEPKPPRKPATKKKR